MSSVVRLGLLVTRAVWPDQREVPYATMEEKPPSAYASSNQANPPLPPPGTQSQQTPVKAEEPGCLCGAMTLAQGAIVIGIAQIVIYFVTVPTVFVLVDEIHPFRLHYLPLVILAVFHLTWNFLLIVGALTGRRRLVRGWNGYHAAKTLLAVAGLIYLLIVLSHPPKASWVVMLGVSMGLAAFLVLEVYFLSVGVRLSRRLATIMGQMVPVVVIAQPGQVVFPHPVEQRPPSHQ